jgi:hypothetical protein
VKVYNPARPEQQAFDPFTIEQVHVKGTLTIQPMPNIYERINIHEVRPLYSSIPVGGSMTYLNLDVDRSGLIQGGQIHDSTQDYNIG